MNSGKVVKVLILTEEQKRKIFESKLSENSLDARKLGGRPQKYLKRSSVNS